MDKSPTKRKRRRRKNPYEILHWNEPLPQLDLSIPEIDLDIAPGETDLSIPEIDLDNWYDSQMPDLLDDAGGGGYNDIIDG